MKLGVFILMSVFTLPFMKQSVAQIFIQDTIPCIDNYEPNDERKQATEIQTNEAYHALISTPLDVDWYKFVITADAPNVLIRLFHLPQDYNIFLYDSSKHKIGSSKNTGTLSDTIIINGLPPGKYAVKVRARAGQFDVINCYVLRVRASVLPNREIGADNFTIDHSQFDLYPNPTTDKLFIQFDDKISSPKFCIFNLVGEKISQIKDLVLDENANAEIDVSTLSAGEYFLKISCNERTEVKKFIVTR